jgi:hypothetical protein
MAKPTPARLAELLSYDEVTGRMYWLVQRGRQPAGAEAGTANGNGYTKVRVDRCPMYRHQIAWVLKTGSYPPDGYEVDHRRGVQAGDQWENLRLATRAEQMMNTKVYTTNTSGHRGVYWKARDSKWACGVYARGMYHHGGAYEYLADAIASYETLRRQLHGEFIRV